MAGNYVSGLASGLDWGTMITQLVALQKKPITLLEADKAALSEKRTAWNEVNTMLLSLKTAAGSLSASDDFDLFTPSATIAGTSKAVKDLLGYAVGSNASEGSYDITVNKLATAQKIASTLSFSSTSEALGIAGDVVINNRVLSIAATDSLAGIQKKINALNSGNNPAGVTASIVSVSDNQYQLTLTSKNTGADGFSIANGASVDVLSQLGLTNSTLTLRHAVTGGAKTGTYSSSSTAIGGLLGLSSPASGTVTIGGQGVAINLASDSLEAIRDKIQATGITASIVTSTVDDKTAYALQINDTQFTDSNNILQTLGVLKQGYTKEITAGQDAEFRLDGNTITRSSNQISDVISGVTLNLLGTDVAATITLNVDRDYDGIKKKIQNIVDGYNKVMSYIADQGTVSAEGETNNPLFADASLQTIKSTLRSTILSGVSGLNSSLDHLSIIGVNIDKTGQLSINDKTLDGYLRSNFADVVNLFAAQGTSTSGYLSYVAAGQTMAEGDYEVEISRAATRASIAGSGFTGTLSGDATLSLTAGGTTQNIALSAGWDMNTIVNAINAGNTMDITATNDGGQLRLASDYYGTYGAFTVSVTGGNLGPMDGAYTGLDVIGRIREQGSAEWMTMTGKGQTLTGDDNQSVEGLMLSYTGTNDTATLDFKFIKGVSEKLDQALFSMSDSLDGYVADKQTSLQNQMNKIDRKIESMEARLTRYQETLTAKFTAMEKMLSTLQSQQSWLTGQLNNLNGK